MQYLDTISKMKEWSLIIDHYWSPYNIKVIQVYAWTSDAEEAEVEWFHDDLQDLLSSLGSLILPLNLYF